MKVRFKADWFFTIVMLVIMLSGYPLIQAAGRLAETHAMHSTGVAMTIDLRYLTAGFFP